MCVAAASSISFALASRGQGYRFMFANPMQLGDPKHGFGLGEIAPRDVLPSVYPIPAYLLEARLAKHHQRRRDVHHAEPPCRLSPMPPTYQYRDRLS
jgi:hypothetical protein